MNANRVRFSGNPGNNPDHPYYTTKMGSKTYSRYTGYPGGLKTMTAIELHRKRPEMILQEAVRRMLPKSKLGRQMLKNLRLCNSPDHPHQAQNPQPFPEYLLPKK